MRNSSKGSVFQYFNIMITYHRLWSFSSAIHHRVPSSHFRKRLERLKAAQKEPSPKTKAILQSLNEINSDQKTEDFLQCLINNYETSDGSSIESKANRRDNRRVESSRVDARFPPALKVRQHAGLSESPTLSSYSDNRKANFRKWRTTAQRSIQSNSNLLNIQTTGKASSYARNSETLPRRNPVPANRTTCPLPSTREPSMTPNSWQLGGLQSASAPPAFYR